MIFPMFFRVLFLCVVCFSSCIVSAPYKNPVPIQSQALTTSNETIVGAQKVMLTSLQDCYAVFSRKDLTPEAKLPKLSDILAPRFDFHVMTKLSVGKTYWMGLSDAQQLEIAEAFKRYLEGLYLGQLTQYNGETIIVREPVLSGNKISVDVDIKSRDSFFKMTFKLYVKNGQYKVYDVEVKGISTIQTFATQFRPYLSSNRYSELIRVLKTK